MMIRAHNACVETNEEEANPHLSFVGDVMSSHAEWSNEMKLELKTNEETIDAKREGLGNAVEKLSRHADLMLALQS